ncbi:unnamed protein product [Phytophthora lilii]|uniref:Unnamed protein product n=1 Tax=Phytophthora lilii TaxID=2077276 RepID=A0A9W6U988_9STRA|nr:unnamed protein product [Phytophthora lilii]
MFDATGMDLLLRVEVLDEADVQAGSEQAADERADDGDPEVEAASREHLPAPASKECEETRAEVASRVKCVARVEAERHANARQHESNCARKAVRTGRLVELVADSEDAAHKESRADNLICESRPVGDLFVRVGGEDALRGRALGVLDVEPWVVHHKHYPCSSEGAKRLRNEVTRQLVPLKATECGEGQRDCGVQVAATHATGKVDAEQQRNPPAQVHRQVVAGITTAEHILCNGAVADEHQDESAEELSEVGAEIWVAHGVEWQARVAFEVSVSRLKRSVLGHVC